jgi:hypothetical protein
MERVELYCCELGSGVVPHLRVKGLECCCEAIDVAI